MSALNIHLNLMDSNNGLFWHKCCSPSFTISDLAIFDMAYSHEQTIIFTHLLTNGTHVQVSVHVADFFDNPFFGTDTLLAPCNFSKIGWIKRTLTATLKHSFMYNSYAILKISLGLNIVEWQMKHQF